MVVGALLSSSPWPVFSVWSRCRYRMGWLWRALVLGAPLTVEAVCGGHSTSLASVVCTLHPVGLGSCASAFCYCPAGEH